MNRFATVLLVGLLSGAVVCAVDDSQLYERLNPLISQEDVSEEIDYSIYPVKLGNNHVNLNGDSWDALRIKFDAAGRGDSTFTVVYLGDSHVQADFGGSVLRRRLAAASRYRGRGLIAPLKLAGTNQPLDYGISISSEYIASSLIRTPWSTEMSFSGAAVQPMTDTFCIKLNAPVPTSRMRLFSRGELFELERLKADGEEINFDSFVDRDGLLNIIPERSGVAFELGLKGDRQTVLGGVELLSDSVGTIVHSIGNNGATYSSYSLIERFGSEFAALGADLVVIALGTNEAFGRTTASELTNNMDNLLESIRRYSPRTKIMLVGPAECFKKTYIRRKGRRRVRSQVVNTKVATIARTIRQYAEANNIPYYNTYAVAGRASAQRRAHLLSKDGVHYTRTGYNLWGNLLADAILEKLRQ